METTGITWSEEEVKSISEYVGLIASKMGLGMWNIAISNEGPEDMECTEVYATIVCAPYGREATIRFGQEFKKASLSCMRETVVHELTHCITDPMRTYCQNVADRMFKKQGAEIFNEGVHGNDEMMVDHLAKVLSPYMPIPAWGPGTVLPVRVNIDAHVERLANAS